MEQRENELINTGTATDDNTAVQPDAQADGTKKKKKKTSLLGILCAIGLAIAVGILVYPSFMDALYDTFQMDRIGGYQAAMNELTEKQISSLRKYAIEYNEKIYEEQKTKTFVYQGEDYDDPVYDSILSASSDSLVMGYIEIPCIDLYLPITHGTKTNDLGYMVGHMYGSSVPIGGENTHSVIAAHTGLQNSDLFTHVEDMKIGDEFYIHVLNEIHVYTVDQIKIVLPGDEPEFLQITDGEDYVTLFTCTPYGINSHRLLVRGTRTGDIDGSAAGSEMSEPSIRNFKAFLLMILLGLLPIIILILGILFSRRKEKKKEKEPENTAGPAQEAAAEEEPGGPETDTGTDEDRPEAQPLAVEEKEI